MLNQQNKLFASFFILMLFMATSISKIYASEVITFGPLETHLEGSIKYSVLGTYTAHFNKFVGRIILNERSLKVESVYLDIDARSIQSEHPLYDRMARSRRLLHTSKYPHITFRSDRIIEEKGLYKVKGVLEMHGIKRRMIFPFNIKINNNPQGKYLQLNGVWNVDRKDFNIIWNRFLDHGGIMVSDIFTVSWGIRVKIS